MLISKFENDQMDKKILVMEEKYSISLPKGYKQFLIQYNGGYTPSTKFKIGKISSDIRGFYGIGKVNLSLDSLNLNQWIESFLFPIACDSFGNYIVIKIDFDNYGEIYFWNHEGYTNINYLAKSLVDFLVYCKSKKINDDFKKSIKEREETLIARGRGDIINDSLRAMWQAEIDKYSNMIQEKVALDNFKHNK